MSRTDRDLTASGPTTWIWVSPTRENCIAHLSRNNFWFRKGFWSLDSPKKIASAIEEGLPPKQAFDQKRTSWKYSNIAEIRYREEARLLEVVNKNGKEVSIISHEGNVAGEMFEALSERLGSQVERTTGRMTAWAIAQRPIIVFCVFLVLAFVCFIMSLKSDDEIRNAPPSAGRGAALKQIFNDVRLSLGPVGMLTCSALIAATGAGVLVHSRIYRPIGVILRNTSRS